MWISDLERDQEHHDLERQRTAIHEIANEYVFALVLGGRVGVDRVRRSKALQQAAKIKQLPVQVCCAPIIGIQKASEKATTKHVEQCRQQARVDLA